MKIENRTTYNIKLNLEELVQTTFAALPRNHTLGITRVVFVDRIEDRSIPADKRDKLRSSIIPKPHLQGLGLRLLLPHYSNKKVGGGA